MIRNLLLTLTTLAIVLACATAQQPKFEFPSATRIGIVNHLEGYATHRNFSSLRFDSFSKQIDVDWDIPAYIENRLSNALKADPRYTVILIQPAEPMAGMNQEPELSDRTFKSKAIKPEMANYLNSIGDKYEVDVLISVRSYRGPGVIKIDKHPIELQGYGLFTKQLLMSKRAYAYANIAVEVFKTGPLTYIGSGKPENRKSALNNIDLEGSLKNLPRSEIDKIEPIMKEYAEQAIENAMVNANLLPPDWNE
jgi:hypothetical protein